MLLESTRVRLGESHRKKLNHLQQQTGLNTSQILRILIDSAALEVRAVFPENNKPATGLVYEAETVSGFASTTN